VVEPLSPRASHLASRSPSSCARQATAPDLTPRVRSSGLLLLAGYVSCGAAAAGRAAAGAGPGRGPRQAVWRGQRQAVWRGAAVLRRCWPPSPCWGAAPCGLCLVAGGWLVLVRGCGACRTVGGGLQSGAAFIDVRLDVGPLPPRSSSQTVAGCWLGGFPVRRDQWGGERVVGGVLPRISIGAWGLCDRLCLVLVCRGRYNLGGGFFSSFWDRVWAE
jgi:hypothetical protein